MAGADSIGGLKGLRRLARQRSARAEARAYVIEGTRLVADALDAGAELVRVFAEPGAPSELVDRLERAGVPTTSIAEGRLHGVTSTTSPQPVAAVARMPVDDLTGAVGAAGGLALVLVGVNDPGNVGTLVRTAQAAGAGAVLCCDESADLYNPKCVRAAAGALFTVRTAVEEDAVKVMEELRRAGLRCVGTSPRASVAYDALDLRTPTAWVLGSESHGLGADVLDALDEQVAIPMHGQAESLNVAMAGAVLCFESARQRRRGSGVRSSN